MTVNLPTGTTIRAHYLGDDTSEFSTTDANGETTATVYLKGHDADQMWSDLRDLNKSTY